MNDCGHEGEHGTDAQGKTHCYACCATVDRKAMHDTGRATLYLNTTTREITNWPGSLKLYASTISKGRHNIAGTRYDVWFAFEGSNWHGVQYGENTQLVHCKRIAWK